MVYHKPTWSMDTNKIKNCEFIVCIKQLNKRSPKIVQVVYIYSAEKVDMQFLFWALQILSRIIAKLGSYTYSVKQVLEKLKIT